MHRISEVTGLDTKLNEYSLTFHNNDGIYGKKKHTHDISDTQPKTHTQINFLIK